MTAVESIQAHSRAERRDLWVAAGTSFLLHSLGFGLWLLVGSLALAWHAAALTELHARQAQREAQRQQPSDPPTVFVEVAPEQMSAEPPKDTHFYSAANSLAANPDATVETQVPKIDGSQDKMPKTVDVLQPQPPQPITPPEPAPQPPEVAQATPPAESAPGDLALAKPASERTPREPAPPPRPRTLAEARMQQGLLAGQKMKQDGGVKRRGAVSLDVKATPFGAYDAAVIAAIQKRWYDLLEDSTLAPRSGKVIVEFTMHYDGRVTDLKILEQEVGEILALYCRKAISDPAPYAPWPNDMRRMIGKDVRDVRITFFYL